MLTHCLTVAYDPKATAPLWDAFLRRVLPNADTRLYFQKAVGYSVTGSCAEQVFFLLHGTGSNGKSTALETVATLLGPLAWSMNFETFLASKESRGTQDIHKLQGVRFALAAEPDAGRRLNEARIKMLTGGERINARALYQAERVFDMTAKIWLACNTKPVVQGVDEGIWRRVKSIPFTVQIAAGERDIHLKEKLRAELPGILAWAIAGARAWVKGGLGTCAEVDLDAASYRSESDSVAQFLAERCELGRDKHAAVGQMVKFYNGWSRDNRAAFLSARALLARIQADHPQVKPGKLHGGLRVWSGVGLLPVDNEDWDVDAAGRVGQ
jgi:putative DNA primase/helicase